MGDTGHPMNEILSYGSNEARDLNSYTPHLITTGMPNPHIPSLRLAWLQPRPEGPNGPFPSQVTVVS